MLVFLVYNIWIMDNSDLRQLGPHQLGPILMETQPLLKLIYTKLTLFHIYYLSTLHINNVLYILRDKFAWKWLLEGSILQMMATLLKLLLMYLI